MLSLHTNAATLSAQASVGRTQSSLSTSMTRLSTGYRINSAMDDAAGLQIATRLKAQTSGMAVAMRNTQNATSMMQTAEGALGEASNILVRMKDLATQAADASSNDGDKTAMQSEYDALASELTNIIGNTSFGGAKLLNSKASSVDVAAANLKYTTANTAHTNATTTLGTAHTTPGVPGTAPSGGTGALGEYETAVWNYSEAATPADKTSAFEAMITARATLDKATETFAKAETDLEAATKYRDAVVASNDPDGTAAGKFTAAVKFQIGASSSETMELNLSTQVSDMHTALGKVSKQYNAYGAVNSIPTDELTGAGKANLAVDDLQAAIDSLGAVRSSLGAAANRLDHVNSNLANVSSNTEAAAGRIMDVDFATESSKMTQSQMLMQAGTAMLKQTNQMSSMVMSLLQ